ncbi:2-desacetyl-2-hydroxyethyl bacteriochlorophyllide A dehydrogenase [Thermocatellispora tengchongensis]|uniref:2-desacetyl-2-hydroxyethyl bacteriochlorophyllide A dehydrogenase n=1 Tax=Thermocatellispora tengchongensis TaxID=1073253 RepID=A0A840NZ41_9ACTN|nr:alcohol dehydrogenase catalytic domain-containing protein [Thermocatellispora tengchongensis]MBB5130973.1 2-desacetyl-2-hydroxyethyl bacteriochlorophyllide A dehydrogenase [Thermocatellispora tengchongensis]
MRVAVVTAPEAVELREEPTPQVGPDEVRVEVGATGLCTMERRLYSGEKKFYPVAPGHEVAGRVAEVGAAVAELPGSPRVGDTVTVDLLTRCGTCAACRRGRTALCKSPQGGTLSDGTVSFGAGLSDNVVVKATQVFPTGTAPIEHAAMGEPLACVAHSLRLGGLRAGDRVAVIGAGYMGRVHLALARHRGAASVGLIDVSADRLAEARTAGATWTAAPDEAVELGGKQDLVFVTAGAPGALELAVSLCDDGGTVVLYGAFDKSLSVGVSPDAIHHHELSIVGVYSHEPEDWREAAALIASGVLAADLDALVTARFPLDAVADAFKLAATSPVYRVLVGGA